MASKREKGAPRAGMSYEGEKFVPLGPVGLSKAQREAREKFLREFKKKHPSKKSK